MPDKTVPREIITACATRAGWRPQDYDSLLTYVPPQTLEEWKSSTSAAGRLWGTRSRGDRLQAVDRQYNTWISGSLTNVQNVTALFDSLERYRGWSYRVTGVGPLSADLREERDSHGGHLSKVHNLAKLLALFNSDPVALATAARISEAEAKKIRRRMVCLLGNIKMEWQWHTDLLGGLDVAKSISEVSGLTDIIKGSTVAQACIGGTLPPVAVTIGTIATAPPPPPTGQTRSGWSTAWEKFKAFLKKVFNGFMDWAKGKLAAILGLDVSEIIGTLSTILNLVFSFVMEKATPFIGAAKDMASGAYDLFKATWERSTLATQARQLVTREGSFALIASGIDAGLQRAQAVAAWTLAKGSIALGMAFIGADKVAELVLGALEFVFKLCFNLYQNSAMKDFLSEAELMWKKVRSQTVQMWEEGIDWAIATTDMSKVKKRPSGWMPPFKAINYTWDEFLDNKSGAYLNFLHSCVNASPLLAAVIMNTGIVRDHRDVFHVATSHSESDDTIADDHVRTLKAHARDFYQKCSFRVKPANVTDFTSEDSTEFSTLVNNAKLALNPEPFVLSSS